MPNCQGCNASYDDSFAFCPFCGRAKPEDPKINLEVNLRREATPDDCPKCKNNLQTQKVSSIVACGTNQGYGKAYTTGSTKYQSRDGSQVGAGYTTGTTTVESINQNLLAGKLNAPIKPEKKKTDFSAVWMLLFSIIMLMVGFTTDAPPVCIGLFVLFLVGSIFGLTQIPSDEKKEEEKFQKNLSAYKKGLYIWNHIYYCHKHDIIFMEGHHEFAEVEQTLNACYEWGEKFVELTESGKPVLLKSS